MTKYENLRKELESFRNAKQKEMKLRPIENWMTENLGVSRLKSTGGSKIAFMQPILQQLGRDGIFCIHLIHGKRREMIRKFDFREFLYRPLIQIIELLEMEEDRA